MRVRLLGADDSTWPRFLDQAPHDFHHLPAYARLCARIEGGEATAVHVTDGRSEMLLPIVIRPIDATWRDATSPYGYPGPLVAGPTGSGFAAEALRETAYVLAREGVVTLFVRLHPLLGGVPEGVGVAIRHGTTVSVDLSLPATTLWGQTRPGHRREIERARRAGYRVSVDESWRHLETFRDLYRATMERVGAESYYFFGDDYFDELRAALDGRLRLVVVERNGVIAAAGLFAETARMVEYHLSATDELFAHDAPTKLMLDWVRAWAKDRGARWLHLGGGVGGADDSLLRFKAGFSPLRHPFHTIRIVLLEREYQQLVLDRDPRADPTRLDGFFPLYRRPAVAA